MKYLTPTVVHGIAETLRERECGITDLVEISGLSEPAVRAHVKALLAGALIFVATWAPDSRGIHTVRKYKWGSAPNVPRPPAVSAAQRMANSRAAKKNGSTC